MENSYKMKKALIFVPTGNNPDTFDERYDKNAHWRSKHPDRTYEIVSCVYKEGFEPNPNVYDYLYFAYLFLFSRFQRNQRIVKFVLCDSFVFVC